MGIFDKIFKKKSPDKEPYDKMPFYWIDDFCQIEIVPRKNIEHIKRSIKTIEKFELNTRTENGFTDIYIREDLPFPTSDEEFRKDYFDKLMAKNGLLVAKQINYDGRKIIECSAETTNAFSFGSFNIFYDCKNGLVTNIWITSLHSSKEHFDNILETLYEIGEEMQLILIDWNSSELIDLSNRNQIMKYLLN